MKYPWGPTSENGTSAPRPRFLPEFLHKRPSLSRINETISTRLGAANVPGNAQPAAFNRQIAMYLAHSFGWSLQQIGKFYKRHHTSVCHSFQKVQALREQKPELDAFITELRDQIANPAVDVKQLHVADLQIDVGRVCDFDLERLADLVADKLYERMKRGKK